MISKISLLLNSFTKIDEDLFEQLEETLIMSDVGVDTSLEICDRLRKKIKEQGIKDPKEIMRLIHEIVADMMGDDTVLDLSTSPSVIMVIGVNGAGKTTTIGKLCHKLKGEGKKVLVAAADTFRAAAIDQLQVWTERAGVDIVKHAEGSDAAAVVYDAITAAKARNCDVVVVDTAGRLHNKKNLMDELAKINRIVSQQAEGCSREILLVLDATTGQNAVNQAKLFKEAADITGIVLTKLDGTAKGGIVISIKNELNIPVKLIGLGEKIDDLQDFNSIDFVNALFGDEVLDGSFDFSDDYESAEESEPETEEATETAYESEPETEEATETAYESEPETEEAYEAVYESEPETEEAAEVTYESEPETEEAYEVTYESEPETEEAAEVTYENEPETEEAYEATYESKPETEEATEVAYENESESEEAYEAAYESEPETEEAYESTYESKPETEEAYEATYENEPETEEAAEVTYESEPETDEAYEATYENESDSEESAEEESESEPEETGKKRSFFDFFRRKKKKDKE